MTTPKYTNQLGRSAKPFESTHRLCLVSTPDTKARIEEVAHYLYQALGEKPEQIHLPFTKFDNGEWKVEITQTVRQRNVVFMADVQSNYGGIEFADPGSRYELSKDIIDALKIAGAETVTAIYPYFHRSRSDKPEKSGRAMSKKRVPAGAARTVAELKNLEIERLMTFDIHNTAILPLFGMGRPRVDVAHIPHGWVIDEALMRAGIYRDFAIGGTDLGGTDKLQPFVEDYEQGQWIAFKLRELKGSGTDGKKLKNLTINEGTAQIKGKHIVLYDDMIDTAGTLQEAVKLLSQYGPLSITVVATHGLFNGPALERLQAMSDAGQIKKVYVTDSVYRENLPGFIEVMPTSKIIAHNIALGATGQSLELARHDINDVKKYAAMHGETLQ